jgi:hypothetical protein
MERASNYSFSGLSGTEQGVQQTWTGFLMARLSLLSPVLF